MSCYCLGPGTTTDTDNDNDLLQSTSTTRPSYPVNIVSSDHQSENKFKSKFHSTLFKYTKSINK